MPDGSISDIPVPPGFDIPARAAFTPTKFGVRRIVIDVDRVTGVYRVSATPCPATADAWGPTDAPEVSSPDLLAAILALPDKRPEKLPALLALQRLPADLVAVFKAVLAGRE